MNTQTFIILVAIGLLAGLLSGVMGIGGGIIIVPALIYFLSLTQHQAQGISLGVLIMPVGILAVINYYKAGNLNFQYSAFIALGFVVGGFIGSKISLGMSQDAIKKVFSVVLIVVAVKMLIGK
ncbi:MAG: sulfite exporter TauE/SafE family protein [Bacteroidia bacterium]|jgi:uncharacterized membrane protein YfcA